MNTVPASGRKFVIKDKKVLGIIPARSGSKDLPRKNILPLAGKPLIVWTIEAADGSKYIDRCIVSTDCEEIAKVAEKYGGDVPFMRPVELATDEATSESVILHAIDALPQKYDMVVLLQPTSPLRTSENIDKALDFMLEKKAPAIVSVVKTEHPPEWSVRVGNNLKMSELAMKLERGKRRQDYPPTYHLNGAIYAAKIYYYLKKKTFIMEDTIAFIMPPERSVDIDSRLDFRIAELIMKDSN